MVTLLMLASLAAPPADAAVVAPAAFRVGVSVGFDPWVPGAVPPARPGYVWVPGRYDAYGVWVPGWYSPVGVRRGYVFEPGYWRDGVYVDGFWRPANRVHGVWVPGHYVARGWVPGHWARG